MKPDEKNTEVGTFCLIYRKKLGTEFTLFKVKLVTFAVLHAKRSNSVPSVLLALYSISRLTDPASRILRLIHPLRG